MRWVRGGRCARLWRREEGGERGRRGGWRGGRGRRGGRGGEGWCRGHRAEVAADGSEDYMRVEGGASGAVLAWLVVGVECGWLHHSRYAMRGSVGGGVMTVCALCGV